MFRTVKIELNAANPQMPLMPVEPFVGSAVSVVILNVPRAVGSRQITGVTLTVTNVAGAACGVAATRSGSAWSATIPASAIGTSGTVANGIVVSASGKDEAGATVPQWIIGAGDLIVHNLDSSVTPGVARNTVFWFDAQPEVPAKGNIAVIGGVVKIYNGNEWISMGGGSPDAVTHAEFANVSALSNATLNQTSAKVNEILTLLKGTAALALALCAFAAFGVDATTQFGEVSPTTTVQKVVDSGAVNFYTKGDADAKFFATPKATYQGDEIGMLSWFSNQKQLVVGQEDMGELCGSLLVAGGATDPATLKVGSSNSGRGIEMSANCLDNTNTYVKVAGDEIVYGISTNGGLSYLHGNVNLTLPTPVDAYTKAESDAKFFSNSSTNDLLTLAKHTSESIAGDKSLYSMTDAFAYSAASNSVQFLTLGAGTNLVITPPPNETGKVMDWVIYANAEGGNLITLTNSVNWYATEAAVTNQLELGVTAFYCSQMSASRFVISRQKLKNVVSVTP